jgi:predicted RNase H-like nuclease
VRWTGGTSGGSTLALLDAVDQVVAVRHPSTLTELATTVAELADQEPFLLAVNVALVAPRRGAKSRPVDNLVRRRFGFRLAPAARGTPAAPDATSTGDALLAALAAAGAPSLPYPDRDRRKSGLAEIHAGLVLKVLLWEGSPAARAPNHPFRQELFRAYGAPSYRPVADRGTWMENWARIDVLLRALRGVPGYDLGPAGEALAGANSDADVARAGSILDASLLAGTARRYLEAPGSCVFLGDATRGYTILPADSFIRRIGLREGQPTRGQLFPRASLGERLSGSAEIRPLELLAVPGRPQRLEAVFRDTPVYEFDNLDEMLWWKHCRHLSGPLLPTEGLQEMNVRLEPDEPEGRPALRLVRSRHRTLSFRFDPPDSWRSRLATRDGKTYPFRVLRANYDILPAAE